MNTQIAEYFARMALLFSIAISAGFAFGAVFCFGIFIAYLVLAIITDIV